jgi:hypothetical protein
LLAARLINPLLLKKVFPNLLVYRRLVEPLASPPTPFLPEATFAYKYGIEAGEYGSRIFSQNAGRGIAPVEATDFFAPTPGLIAKIATTGTAAQQP